MTTPEPEETARVQSEDVPFTPRQRTPDVQFAPGTMIAGRYRISSILGSGGMGEVYRADDTKLGQPVALKFLPMRLARDQTLLSRLHDEVRLGRQIAHPNVCRIYDIVDADGAHFVAMEFVDGEDLSRLLRRIGRLAHDKAVDIARGIAAGLMAAHNKGILHRDLKPANIMVDSSGDARIMDFGLALGTGEDDGTISGTPAYMAPEQLAGATATVQSDLYALGLVMYELFTGKRAHNARTMPERVREISSQITTPSDVIRDIDPAVERIILRCLASDPGQRPHSAREVIASLPGGDPLAAAMAAGETPSPRIVAAAGTEGTLKPAIAWTLLAATIGIIAVFFGLTVRARFWQRSGLTRTPDAQAERATEVLRRLGVPAQPFRSYGFMEDMNFLQWAADHDRARLERLDRGFPLLRFWMREESAPLIDRGLLRTPAPTLMRPPQHAPGAVAAEIDLRGRLVSLRAIASPSWKAKPLDWNALLQAAGLDPAKLTRVQPSMLPPSFADARAAWTGRHPEDNLLLRVEAAAFRGVPVFFRITTPADAAPSTSPFEPGGAFHAFGFGLIVVALAAGSVLAWRNLRQRRGDRQGALRVGAALFLLTFIGRIVVANHKAVVMHELSVLALALSDGLLIAALFSLLYLALEPYIRRKWPQGLISWARLMSGNWRSPMIGRDILVGLLAGLFHALVASGLLLPEMRDLPFARGWAYNFNTAMQPLGTIAMSLQLGITQGLAAMVILMLLMIVLRRRAFAAAGLFALLMFGYSFVSTEPQYLLMFALIATSATVALCGFGLLAMIAAQAVFHGLFHAVMPDALDWYTLRAIIPTLFFVTLAVWAFRTSLGDQKVFGTSLLDT